MWKLFYSLVNNTTIQTQGDKDVEIILQFGKQYYHPNTGRHIYTYQDFDKMEEKTFWLLLYSASFTPDDSVKCPI